MLFADFPNSKFWFPEFVSSYACHVTLLRMLYIDWVPVFCWRIGFKCFGIKGPSIFVVRVILWLFKYILVDLVIP